MGIEKARRLAHESVYWINIHTDTKKTVKQCATCMEYQQTQLHEKITPYKLPYKPREVVGADIFTIKNNTLLCIADYYSQFHIVKKADGLSVGNLIKAVKTVFAEFRLPKKIVLDAGTNLISDKFKQFCSN